MNDQTVQTIKNIATQTRQQSAGNLALADALDVAARVAETGWQTDQDTVTKGVADGIAAQLPAAVDAQTTVLQGKIDDLTHKLADSEQAALTANDDLKKEQDAHAANTTAIKGLQGQVDTLTTLKTSLLAALQDATQPDDTARVTAALALLGVVQETNEQGVTDAPQE